MSGLPSVDRSDALPGVLGESLYLGLVSRGADREEKKDDPLRLELEPEHAARAADIRSGRVVLSLGAAKSFQGQALACSQQTATL